MICDRSFRTDILSRAAARQGVVLRTRGRRSRSCQNQQPYRPGGRARRGGVTPLEEAEHSSAPRSPRAPFNRHRRTGTPHITHCSSSPQDGKSYLHDRPCCAGRNCPEFSSNMPRPCAHASVRVDSSQEGRPPVRTIPRHKIQSSAASECHRCRYSRRIKRMCRSEGLFDRRANSCLMSAYITFAKLRLQNPQSLASFARDGSTTNDSTC